MLGDAPWTGGSIPPRLHHTQILFRLADQHGLAFGTLLPFHGKNPRQQTTLIKGAERQCGAGNLWPE